MGLNINQPPFPGEFHTKGCVWQHTFLITGGKRGLSIALIYYCVLNLMHFFLRGSRRGKQAIIVIVASRGVWLTKNVPSTLAKRTRRADFRTLQRRFRSFCDYSISDWTWVHLPGFYPASLCKGQPGRADAMEREPGLLGLIGVMFSWTLELLLRLHGGLSGAGSCGREGRATTDARYAGRWSVHPILSLRGTPTVTHGTLVTRSLRCCGTTGGAVLIIRGADILKKHPKEDLISNHIYAPKTRISVASGDLFQG